MKIRTSGLPLKIDLRSCYESVRFFGKKLLPDKIYSSIKIKIDFVEDIEDFAYCQWNDTNFKGRNFTITVDSNLSIKETLLALAHEMVHVKQYATGQMKDYIRLPKTRWNNKVFEHDKIDYWDQEWEIEAHGREKGLVVHFLDYKKSKVDWKGNGKWVL
jgi:hypothetical protein